MAEQPSSQSQSEAFAQEPEAPSFTIIVIDQSSTNHYNYHYSRNQTTTEVVNSNNVSSTQARNSTLNGDSSSRFHTEWQAPSRSHPPASAQRPPPSSTGDVNQVFSRHPLASPSPSSPPQRRRNSYPPSSPHLGGLRSSGYESIDTNLVGPGTSQLHREPPASHSFRSEINREHSTSQGHTLPTNGILTSLPFIIRRLVAWVRSFSGTSDSRELDGIAFEGHAQYLP